MRKGFGIAAAAATVLSLWAVPGSGAAPQRAAWSSSWFRSPSGNIRCRWFTYDRVLACKTLNNGRVGVVPLYGSAYYGYFTDYSFPSGPILGYGQYWTSRIGTTAQFRCDSRPTGMTCSMWVASRTRCST